MSNIISQLLDSMIISNKILCALPGQFKICTYEVKDNCIISNEACTFSFPSYSIKQIFKIVTIFLTENKCCENTFENDFGANSQIYNVDIVTLSKENLLLTFKQCSADSEAISFSKNECKQLLNSISHLFYATLNLTPINAFCFNEIINYFSDFPAEQWETVTSQTLKNMRVNDFLKLLEDIIKNSLGNTANAMYVYMCLSRYENLLSTLIKMRLVKDVF